DIGASRRKTGRSLVDDLETVSEKMTEKKNELFDDFRKSLPREFDFDRDALDMGIDIIKEEIGDLPEEIVNKVLEAKNFGELYDISQRKIKNLIQVSKDSQHYVNVIPLMA